MLVIATSGVAKAAQNELSIPDPVNALEIINGTNTGTTTNNTKSN